MGRQTRSILLTIKALRHGTVHRVKGQVPVWLRDFLIELSRGVWCLALGKDSALIERVKDCKHSNLPH
jgi:hypothetical protein